MNHILESLNQTQQVWLRWAATYRRLHMKVDLRDWCGWNRSLFKGESKSIPESPQIWESFVPAITDNDFDPAWMIKCNGLGWIGLICQKQVKREREQKKGFPLLHLSY